MSHFTITSADKGRCLITHVSSGSTITTDLPPEYGGKGRSFSSTDMVAAAVGSCYFTTIEEILERQGVLPGSSAIEVSKILSQQPKKIAAIHLTLQLPIHPSSELKSKLLKALDLCPVTRSLCSSVIVSLSIIKKT